MTKILRSVTFFKYRSSAREASNLTISQVPWINISKYHFKQVTTKNAADFPHKSTGYQIIITEYLKARQNSLWLAKSRQFKQST